MTAPAGRRFLFSCGVFAPHAGGAESLMRDLGRELIRRGHAVTVLTRRLPGTPRREILDGMRVERLRFPVDYEAIRSRTRLVAGTPATAWRVFRVLTRTPVDAVAIGLLDMSVLYLLQLRRLVPFPLVLYLHGGETRDLPARSPDFRRLLVRCLAESDRIVAVSEKLAEDALRRHPAAADRMEVIPNGVDVASIETAPAESRDRPFVLVVGRLVRGKRLDTVLTAFASVHETMEDIDLVIAGDGPERAGLAALQAELGIPSHRVLWLGTVSRDRVARLMKGALFLVHASASEGDPIVVLEARVAGRLVLAARSVGLEEAITDGVHGAFFALGDADGLGRLMVRLASSPAERARLERRISEEDPGKLDIRALAERHLRVLAP